MDSEIDQCSYDEETVWKHELMISRASYCNELTDELIECNRFECWYAQILCEWSASLCEESRCLLDESVSILSTIKNTLPDNHNKT